jgi:hypothetical protein
VTESEKWAIGGTLPHLPGHPFLQIFPFVPLRSEIICGTKTSTSTNTNHTSHPTSSFYDYDTKATIPISKPSSLTATVLVSVSYQKPLTMTLSKRKGGHASLQGKKPGK